MEIGLGSRVTLITEFPDDNIELRAGHEGTIINVKDGIEKGILVSWDGFEHGHDGQGATADRSCWWVAAEDIVDIGVVDQLIDCGDISELF